MFLCCIFYFIFFDVLTYCCLNIHAKFALLLHEQLVKIYLRFLYLKTVLALTIEVDYINKFCFSLTIVIFVLFITFTTT